MPKKKKQQTVIEKLPLKYVAVLLVAVFAAMLNSWLKEKATLTDFTDRFILGKWKKS